MRTANHFKKRLGFLTAVELRILGVRRHVATRTSKRTESSHANEDRTALWETNAGLILGLMSAEADTRREAVSGTSQIRRKPRVPTAIMKQ